MTQELEQYKNLLKTHDWTYQYSDDHRAWEKGNNAQKVLTELAKKVDPSYNIWNEIAPEMFNMRK